MLDFILLMHNDATAPLSPAMWPTYLADLQSRGIFDGGSGVGTGESFRKNGAPGPISGHIGGYLRVRADSLAEAEHYLIGNPVYECGGTVEIRELPRT